jgi:hypothetical protein
MPDNGGSRPRRAVGDTAYTFISQSSQGQVDGSAWSNPSGFGGRDQAFMGIGGFLVVVAIAWSMLTVGTTRAVAIAIFVVGVVLFVVGLRGYRRERARVRAMAEQIEREQNGPVG